MGESTQYVIVYACRLIYVDRRVDAALLAASCIKKDREAVIKLQKRASFVSRSASCSHKSQIHVQFYFFLSLWED